jgi:hypothetical protein
MIPKVPLQAAGAIPQVPLPSPEIVAVAVVFFLAGMAVPTAYGIERFQGFGRSVVAQVPYRSPPGMDKEQALQQAVRREQSVAADDEPEQDGGEG